MRRHPWLARGVASALALATFGLAACTTAAPTASSIATVTLRPSVTPVPGPTIDSPDSDTSPVTVTMVAIRFQFQPTTLEVPAGQPFAIQFRNADDVGTVHDVDIRQLDGVTVLRDQEPVDGGDVVRYRYEPLVRGDYQLICSIHPIPAMTGTLRVR